MPHELSANELDSLVRAIVEEVLTQTGRPRTVGPAARDASQETGARQVSIPAPPHVTTDLARKIAALIDHTLLRPDASRAAVELLCKQAIHYGFAAVCVNPWFVPVAAQVTRGTTAKVCAVIGFPLGATYTSVKLLEAEEAIKLGAREIDVVQNIGALKSAQDDFVEAELRAVVAAVHNGGAICKVILETGLLTREEKVRAILLAARAGADFIKTSTGFGAAGATVEDVALISATAGSQVGIKAAGGVRTLAGLHAMLRAGATRIGSSAGVHILAEAEALGTSPAAHDLRRFR
jgi:deoxyribose-phosphate aldolase